MEERFELSQEEKALLEKSLAKFEKNAKRCKGMQFVLGGLVCLLFFLGIYGMLPMLDTMFTDFDQQAFVEGLGCEEIPEDVPFKYWIVGYVNKAAVLSELNQRAQGVRVFEACLGLIELAFGVLGLVFLVSHWNDGKRNLVISKVIHQHLNGLEKED